MLHALEVFSSVFVFRGIATAHMAAGKTESQMHPVIPHLEALFASLGCFGFRIVGVFQVIAGSRHDRSPRTASLSSTDKSFHHGGTEFTEKTSKKLKATAGSSLFVEAPSGADTFGNRFGFLRELRASVVKRCS
jgi:hypothetical protein